MAIPTRVIKVIDLETTGTVPDSAVISLGAVDIAAGVDGTWAICPNSELNLTFDVPDQVKRGAVFDPDAIEFHLRWPETTNTLRHSLQSKRPMPALFQNYDSLNEALLHHFLYWWEDNQPPCATPVFACRGTDFDPVILRRFLERYGVRVPYKYWQAADIRSLDTFIGLTSEIPYPKKVNSNHLHDALEDAKAAALSLCNTLNFMTSMFRPKGDPNVC